MNITPLIQPVNEGGTKKKKKRLRADMSRADHRWVRRYSPRGQGHLNLILADTGECGKVSYAADVVVVEMTLESIASTELLAATSNHHVTSPSIRLGIRWERIILCVIDRNPAANPLCRSLETSVSTDMAFEIRRAVVALYPFAVGTGPWVILRYRGRRSNTRVRLDVAGEWGMTWSLVRGIFRSLFL